MWTISEAAELSGVSTRTLQYYDEIGLLKPSRLTPSGYRLYDDKSLQMLQQILFFKELGFKLKDIKEILEKPDFDRITAFKEQKELLLLKRNRTDRLIQLLGRLEKGEQCMSFKEFDLSDYIEALEAFKNRNTEEIIRQWGSVENFELFIQKAKEDEDKIAERAVRKYGSVEKYTEAMKYNLEHFSELMEEHRIRNQDLIEKSNALYSRLTADMKKDVSLEEIQAVVHEIVRFTHETSSVNSEETDHLWDAVIKSYSNDLGKAVTDAKYGSGASEYIASALRYYFKNQDLILNEE